MDTLFKEIADEHETKETIWIYKDKIDLYNKYNQFSSSVIKKELKKEEINKEEINKEELIKEELKKNETNKIDFYKPEINKDEMKKGKKDDNNSPLNLIIKYTYTAEIMKKEIKQKLIDFITIPEFAKAFGVKKAADIISALTRDSWNQSMALFISFLLDVNVIYKEKSYIFNKNKPLKDLVI